jgi:adenylate cyclase
MQIKIYRSWAEFKKSHLIRVATLYAITGWMVLEFVIQVFPIFSIPDWVITSMTAIVILGLPFAIIIAVASDRKSGEQKKIIDESEVRISLHANKVSLHEKSIAVLPFINLSSDKENEFFTDGISEEINNVLTQIPGLKVAGRTSSFSYKNKTGDLRNIGSELNVKTILEGSVRRSGNRLRVTAQLIEADSGFHMWSRNFDRELSDIFVIQDEIANEIASKLELSLTQETQRTQTRDVTAYQSYLKGRSLYYQRGTSLFEALKCFENALEIDPQYALAFSGLADTYVMLNFHGYLSPRETWEKAIEASNNALKYGPNVAEAYNSNAIISLYHFRTWDKAGSEFQKALELNPSYMQARLWHALFYKFIIKNDVSDSIRLTELAIDSDPLSAYSRSILALICANIGLYDRAITESNKAVEIDPNSYLSHYVMAYSYQISGLWWVW